MEATGIDFCRLRLTTGFHSYLFSEDTERLFNFFDPNQQRLVKNSLVIWFQLRPKEFIFLYLTLGVFLTRCGILFVLFFFYIILKSLHVAIYITKFWILLHMHLYVLLSASLVELEKKLNSNIEFQDIHNFCWLWWLFFKSYPRKESSAIFKCTK